MYCFSNKAVIISFISFVFRFDPQAYQFRLSYSRPVSVLVLFYQRLASLCNWPVAEPVSGLILSDVVGPIVGSGGSDTNCHPSTPF